MLKAIIVDDERSTRESLSQYLHWSDMGVETVQTARNGLQALELAQRMTPDILLTDIRMPKMNGIELAAKIRALSPACKIIFLSGYADKEYLMEAINLKAVSYVEKPINVQKIESVVMKAIAEYEEDALHRTETLKLMKDMEKRLPYMRQELALELAKEHADTVLLTSRFGDLYTRFLQHESYIAAYAAIQWSPHTDDRTRNSLRRTLLESLEKPIDFGWAACLAGFDSQDNLLLIAAENVEQPAPEQDRAFDRLLAQWIECAAGNFEVTLGIGSRYHQLNQTPVAYKSTAAASARRFYLGSNIAIHDDPSVGCAFAVGEDEYDRFRHFLNANDQANATAHIRRLRDEAAEAEDADTLHVKSVFCQLALIVLEVAADRGIDLSADKNEAHQIWKRFDAFKSLSEISIYVMSYIERMFASIEEKDSVGRKMYDITKFIRAHYTDPSLSTHSIALHSNFSHAYLCTFFKKNMGKTINEFITEIRMDKAKELLKEGHLKLYEIAEALGYKDANYFTTLFKKHTGITPTQFMEKF